HVQELTQARLTRQISHRTAEKGPGGAGPLSHSREDFEEGIPCLSVDGVVVFSSQPVVPHAGRVRHTRVDGGCVVHGSPFGGWGTPFRHLPPNTEKGPAGSGRAISVRPGTRRPRTRSARNPPPRGACVPFSVSRTARPVPTSAPRKWPTPG